jgi:hypothetical protein
MMEGLFFTPMIRPIDSKVILKSLNSLLEITPPGSRLLEKIKRAFMAFCGLYPKRKTVFLSAALFFFVVRGI